MTAEFGSPHSGLEKPRMTFLAPAPRRSSVIEPLSSKMIGLMPSQRPRKLS
jgi:hypothetical protein